MKTIVIIVLSTLLIVTCGSVPFRHRRQISDLTLVNNGSPLQVADQSPELVRALEDTDDSSAFVYDHTEATHSPLINSLDDVAVVINDQEEHFPDVELHNVDNGDNQVAQNVDTSGGSDLDHDDLENTMNSNVSDESKSVYQNGPNHESETEHEETTHGQSLEHGTHGRRNLNEETDGQHFLFGEVDTRVHPIINMTGDNNGHTYTIGLPDENDGYVENEDEGQVNDNQSLNETEIIDDEYETGGLTTEVNTIMSGAGSEEVDSGNGNTESFQNTDQEQQEVSVGVLPNVGQSNDRETQRNIGNNVDNADDVGENADLDFPIDKGARPREVDGGQAPLSPLRHTFNPRTVNVPSVEPTFETPTAPALATPPTEEIADPSIPTTTARTTEQHSPNENVPVGNEGNENMGGTGDGQIDGPDGGTSGVRPDGEIIDPEVTEIPNTITEGEDKGKITGKGDTRVATILSTQTVASFIQSSENFQITISPSPAVVVHESMSSLSISDVSENMSTDFDDDYFGTDIFGDSETASVFDMQTEELFPSSIFVDEYEQSTSTTTFDIYPSYITSSPSHSVPSIATSTSSILVTSLPSLTSISSSSTERLEPSSPLYWHPDITPTRASTFSATPSTSSQSSADLKVTSSPVESTSTLGAGTSSYILTEFVTPSISSYSLFLTPTMSKERSQSITTSFLMPSGTSESITVSSANVLSAPSWSHTISTNTRINSYVIPTPPSANNKKTVQPRNVTSPPIVTRKKPNSGKDKPETSNRTTTLTSTTTTLVTVPVTTNRVLIISTTAQKKIMTTPPSVYIEIRLRMGWNEFCSYKDVFLTEIRDIIKLKKEIEVPMEQFKLTTEYCSDIDPSILSTDGITIQMYIVDTEGKIDDSLTCVTSDLIVKGFRYSDYFKILSVQCHPDKTAERPPEQKSLDKKSSPNITSLVIVIASVGGVCCVVLIVLQILIHRRVKIKRKQKQQLEASSVGSSARSSIRSMDHVALGVIPKSRIDSGYWNPALDDTWDELEPKRLSHVLNSPLLANFCMDTSGILAEFQTIPFDGPYSPSVVHGEEDKNRFGNVLPYKHSRVKLRKQDDRSSDYINANYITGYKRSKQIYIATQSPLVNTVDDFWRMIWEQQTRAILMINPVTQHSKPKQSTCYWPDNFETDIRREYSDYTVTLKKRNVQQDYIECTLELMDIERNLKREIHHFWYTCWLDSGPPEPLSFVKFVLDTRPHYENSGAPVVVHCGPGTGRTCTFIGVDICMRMFEDKRRIDILRCVQKMRHERVDAVQSKEQYLLIYQALNEYSVVLSSPSISTRSSVVTLHAML
ncbi:hypothetical protein ACF0H5_012990 [Mactra antiquata]